MYPAVAYVEPQDDYHLILTFENGEKRRFDMRPYLNLGIFKELRDLRLFKTVRTSFDTIRWDNEAELDPEFLYQQSAGVK